MKIIGFIKNLVKLLINQYSAYSINSTLFNIEQSNISSSSEKKVISFCLFGTDRKYFANIDACIKSYINFFPNWIIRIYVSKDVPEEIILRLYQLNCEVVIMKSKGVDYRYTLWRFLVLDDDFVSYSIIRDIDSIASTRENIMVKQWLESSKKLHVIRDHPDHVDLIMGGMFGLKSDNSLNIKNLMLKFKKLNKLGVDQQFLNLVYKYYANDIFVHDIFLRYESENPIIIPHSELDTFIGEINIDHRFKQRDREKLKDFYHKMYGDNNLNRSVN